MPNEPGDVGRAFAEWWNADGEGADAVAEVGEESVLLDECIESFVCGEDEANVGAHGAVAADGVEIAVFLDDAEQLSLDEPGRFADLVEKECAA